MQQCGTQVAAGGASITIITTTLYRPGVVSSHPQPPACSGRQAGTTELKDAFIIIFGHFMYYCIIAQASLNPSLIVPYFRTQHLPPTHLCQPRPKGHGRQGHQLEENYVEQSPSHPPTPYVGGGGVRCSAVRSLPMIFCILCKHCDSRAALPPLANS